MHIPILYIVSSDSFHFLGLNSCRRFEVLIAQMRNMSNPSPENNSASNLLYNEVSSLLYIIIYDPLKYPVQTSTYICLFNQLILNTWWFSGQWVHVAPHLIQKIFWHKQGKSLRLQPQLARADYLIDFNFLVIDQ